MSRRQLRTLCCLALVSLPWLNACVSPLAATGTPEQIHELAKIKDATVTCVTIGTPYGNGRALFLSLDKGVLPEGSFSVDDACKATITVTPVRGTPPKQP